jgi:hypothetical protein
MTYQSTVLADSPTAYWRFDETTGTNVNDEVATRDITLANVTVNQAPLMAENGRSMYFNGTSSLGTIGSGHTYDWSGNVFTIECWLRPEAPPAFLSTVFSASGNIAPKIAIEDSGKLRFIAHLFGGADVATSAAGYIPFGGQVYHVVWVKNGTSNVIYVNGTDRSADFTITNYTFGVPGGGDTRVGVDPSGSTYYYKGYMDEVAVWNTTALSGSQVAAHYAAATSTGPVWTTPADAASMSTTPELKFNSPASAVAQHFYLELDTANTFNTANLRTYRSDQVQTNWDYWNGSAWTAMPGTGLPSTYAGNEVRYTVTSALSAGTWYRRVRAGTLI